MKANISLEMYVNLRRKSEIIIKKWIIDPYRWLYLMSRIHHHRKYFLHLVIWDSSLFLIKLDFWNNFVRKLIIEMKSMQNWLHKTYYSHFWGKLSIIINFAVVPAYIDSAEPPCYMTGFVDRLLWELSVEEINFNNGNVPKNILYNFIL